MQKYVIINLAEPGDFGPVTLTRSAMQLRMVRETGEVLTADETKAKRLKMEVPVHRLLDALAAIQQGRPDDATEDLVLARDDCADADRIVLCAHGEPEDCEHFYAAGHQQLGDVADLADIVKRVLVPEKSHRLSLAMCYGARTQTYVPDELDAQGPIAADELASSFAYRFFKALHADPDPRQLVMTARTGAMGYRSSDGMSEVEQEAALTLRLLIKAYGRKAKATRWKEGITEAEQRGTPRSRRRALRFRKIDENYMRRPARFAFKTVNRKAKRYHSYIKKRNAAQIERLNYPDLKKYGKIVYRSEDKGEVCITRKYTGGQRTQTVLYRGPWL